MASNQLGRGFTIHVVFSMIFFVIFITTKMIQSTATTVKSEKVAINDYIANYSSFTSSNDSLIRSLSSTKELSSHRLRHNISAAKKLSQNTIQHENNKNPEVARIKTHNNQKPSIIGTSVSRKKWTVRIEGGSMVANEVAQSLGYNNLGLVKGLLHTYLFEEKSLTNDYNETQPLIRDKRDSVQATQTSLLKSNKNVVWVEQLTRLHRVKRSFVSIDQHQDRDYIEQQQLFRQHPRSASFPFERGQANQMQLYQNGGLLIKTSNDDEHHQHHLYQPHISQQHHQAATSSLQPLQQQQYGHNPSSLGAPFVQFHQQLQNQMSNPGEISQRLAHQVYRPVVTINDDHYAINSANSAQLHSLTQSNKQQQATPYYTNQQQQLLQPHQSNQQQHQQQQLVPSTGRNSISGWQVATNQMIRPITTLFENAMQKLNRIPTNQLSLGGPQQSADRQHAVDNDGDKISDFPQHQNANHHNNPIITTTTTSSTATTTSTTAAAATSNKAPDGNASSRGQHSLAAVTNANNNENKCKYDDELWMYQWYLHDKNNYYYYDADNANSVGNNHNEIRSNNNNNNNVHLHVQDAWNMGFTGKNVVVTVIDDGIEHNHTDLWKNYDPMASYDINNNRPNPFPRYDLEDRQNHGTRCAGEIAMLANNKKCGVGVAPDSKIGCIKILDGPLDERIEAMSLVHNLGHIDIYSASWGPDDDGRTVEGPKLTQQQALKDGIERGRKGLGALYIWASGNGGKHGDNCNCDGYVSSLYTISIGSATQRGHFPYYGERCASTLAVTCSSGTLTDKRITTTDLHNRCTTDFVGTSAAAPLAAGIMALVLEANPRITWRDAQHLIAWNSDYYPLRDNTGWFRNSAGLMYNNKFGFGLMNAKLLVESALTWQNVPQKSTCTVVTSQQDSLPEIITTGAPTVVLTFNTDGCQQQQQTSSIDSLSQQDIFRSQVRPLSPNNNNNNVVRPINYLEHVELVATIEYSTRGDLEIFLTSPTGTTSNILTYRPRDKAIIGFTDWSFMSVHFWGERPQGTWTLRVRDKNKDQSKLNSGHLVNATLILHGTTEKPAHMNRPRIYDGEEYIKETIEKSFVYVDPETGHKIHDENPWEQSMYPNDMSPLFSDDNEDNNKFTNSREIESQRLVD